MGTPTSRCCLGHWVMDTLNRQPQAELTNPEHHGRVIYAEDHAEHLWARVEYNVNGQSVASAELYSLAELFATLHQDANEGYCPLENGVTVIL